MATEDGPRLENFRDSWAIRKGWSPLEQQSRLRLRPALNVCVNYGGRWEILEAAKRSREIPEEELTEQKFASLLPLADSGDVDLFIRTSGEERISNFMLWQLAYAELYFTKILWPDFTEKEFLDALNWYSNRERRFGKTSEQIQEEAGKE